MDLRRELTPPPIDMSLIAELARLADALDGASPGERATDAALARFNQLADTNLPLAVFQGISGTEPAEVWVRRVLTELRIDPAPDVTREELIEVVRRAMPTDNDPLEAELYMLVFDANVEMPAASDLIFYAPDDEQPDDDEELEDWDPTPEQIVDIALAYRPRT